MSTVDAPNIVARQLQFVCRWILECVFPLSDGQLRWQPNVSAPSIRFHLFHVARCADIVQYRMSETAGQIWTQEHVASQWNLNTEQLGIGEHGATLPGEDAMHLPLPEKQRLLDYAERVIVALDEAFGRVDDTEFQRVAPGYGGEPMAIGFLITDQLEHMSRHLGMIEAMRGVQGLNGTATI
jgi:hypothetical protein